jgi:ribosome-associated translation inhibitor RaiA
MAVKRNPLSELVVHIGAGFVAKERPFVREMLAPLRSHLGRWDSNDVGVEISLQDRGRAEQRVTLRTTLPGHPPLIAVGADPDLTRAIHEAKRELTRQLEHQKTEREAMHNRRMSSRTIRHPLDPPQSPGAAPAAPRV